MNHNSKTQPEFFDIHSHLNFSQFDEDREEVIKQMNDESIWTITVGTGLKTSEESVLLAEKHDHVFATVGVHPTDWEEQFVESEFDKFVSHPKVVGVGECGLDYFRIEVDDKKAKDKQRDLFIRHIEFASQHEKPLMIHGRPKVGSMDAYQDIYDILTTNHVLRSTNYPGNLHFFVGDKKTATNFLDKGFTISFDGPITFTRDYDEVIKYVPLERIMAETDAPFAAPDPYRGKRNNPLYVKEIYKAIAEIRGENPEIVRHQLTQNALNYWNL